MKSNNCVYCVNEGDAALCDTCKHDSLFEDIDSVEEDDPEYLEDIDSVEEDDPEYLEDEDE